MDIAPAEEAPPESPTTNAFVKSFEAKRTEFEKLRAHIASTELQTNRSNLNELLSDVHRFAIVDDVLTEHLQKKDDETETTERTRSSKRSRSKSQTEKLSEGIIVGVKLNIKTSNPPRFRKAYTLPKAKTIPPYTSWNFVSCNQQQKKLRTQKRLFYTDDDTGETLPASDEEKEMQEASYYRWDEGDVEWRDYCLEAMEREFGHLSTFAQLLSEHLFVDPATIEERRKKTNSIQTIPEIASQLCRRCLRYNCSLHPHSDVLPARPTTPTAHENNGNECSQSCWLSSQERTQRREHTDDADTTEPPAETEEGEWDTADIHLLEKGLDIYGDNSCALSRFVRTKTCTEIHRYLLQHPEIRSRRLIETPRRRRGAKKIVIGNKKGAPVVAKRLRHRETDLWHQYLPCSCKSTCSTNCSCIKSNNFCDKYCACWNGTRTARKTCANAWKGCKCAQRCESQRCPCVAASRECDPDLCSVCRAEDHMQCRNMSIRKRKQKRVAMGLSEIDGWGTFMLENVKKDELIGEYTGELISDDEAERRGRIYDIVDKSYLFSATTETVIDANHHGNKLRFANHSSEPNCYVKYLLVDGDYRVGIFAGRDLYAGEELLYDYGNSFQSNWNAPWMDQGSSAPTDD